MEASPFLQLGPVAGVSVIQERQGGGKPFSLLSAASPYSYVLTAKTSARSQDRVDRVGWREVTREKIFTRWSGWLPLSGPSNV